MSPVFAELADANYTGFRKTLLRTKGSERQRAFLEAVRDTTAFLEHMESIATTTGSAVPILAEPLTEHEFKDPPIPIEQAIHACYPPAAVPPRVACRSAFWASVTLAHLKAGRIESSYLAANGGVLPGGLERIDRALAERTAQQDQMIDSCVRTVLRRLGGLPEVRGARSVYVDCPLARAWWREQFVSQAGDGTEALAGALRAIVRSRQTYWEKFIDRVIIRSPTFGSATVRGAFLRALARHVQDNPDTPQRAEDMQRLTRRAGICQGRQELSILEDADLDALMTGVVEIPIAEG